jgi:hypothetical protein
MDVDHAPIFKDIFHYSPMSSSSPSLPQALVDEFKTRMIQEASAADDWSHRLISAGSNKDQLQRALFAVLYSYWQIVLSSTALQKHVVNFSNPQDIRKLLQSLNDDEVEEWKSAVHNEDWARLITHRMCLARFRRRYIVIWYWHSETSKTS